MRCSRSTASPASSNASTSVSARGVSSAQRVLQPRRSRARIHPPIPARCTRSEACYVGEESPSFQFYPRDFLADTDNLTDAAAGLYMRLLCKQWMHGSLPAVFESDDDRETVMDILPIGDVKERRKSWRLLAKHFKEHPTESGRGGQSRLQRIRDDQRIYREQKALAGSLGGKRTQSERRAKVSTASIPLEAELSDGLVSLEANLSSASASATASAKTTGSSLPPLGAKGRSAAWTLASDVLKIGLAVGALGKHRAEDVERLALREIDPATSLLNAYGRDAVLDRARDFAAACRDGRITRKAFSCFSIADTWDWAEFNPRLKPEPELSEAGKQGMAAIEARARAAAERKAAGA